MDQRLIVPIAARSGAMAVFIIMFLLVLVGIGAGARLFWQRLWRRSEGAATIEFALILPTLMLLMVGGMDLAHMYYVQHIITTASREGARYAAKYTVSAADPSSGDISNYVRTPSGLNYDSFKINNLAVSGSYSGTSPNRIVTVTVNARESWWLLGSLPGFAAAKNLTAATAMSVERP